MTGDQNRSQADLTQQLDTLSDEIDETVTKLKQLQKKIAASSQPASMHELDALVALGRHYGELDREKLTVQALIKGDSLYANSKSSKKPPA